MNKYIKISLTLVWIALQCAAYAPAYASSGSTAFEFLRLDNGARETGLGGAATAAGDATQGVFYNPALISGLSYSNEFSFYNSAWLADISYWNFAYSHQFTNKKDYLGVRYQNLSYGTFIGYDAAGGKISDYTSGSYLLGFTYGRALPNRVYIGVALKKAWERIQDAHANAMLVDAGAVIKTDWYQSVWGIAVRNVGQKIKYDHDSEYAPITFALGCAIKPFGDVFMLSADGEMIQDHNAGIKLGLEANYNKFFYLRGGWDSFVNAGAGLRFGFGLAIKDISVDYAFFPMSDLGSTHHLGVKWAFNGPLPQKKPKAPAQTAVPEVIISTPEAVSPTPEVIISAPEVIISTPEVVSPTPEVIISAPEVVALMPEVIISAPEVMAPTPEVIISAPEVQISTQATEIIAEPQIPIFPITISSQTIESLPASPLKSVGIKIGESIFDREPQNVSNAFNLKVKRVYCWTKIISTKFPTKIKHIWYVDGKKVVEINLPVKAGSWRTWSTTKVFWGRWKVEVVDENGVLLDSIKFTVGDQYYSGSLSITEPVLKSVGIKIGESIFDREPQNVSKTFNLKVKRVYCWTKIISTKFPIKIKHIWYVDGKKVVGINLPVKAGSWRTWSTTGVFWGRWKVEVVDENGVLLDSIKFTVND